MDPAILSDACRRPCRRLWRLRVRRPCRRLVRHPLRRPCRRLRLVRSPCRRRDRRPCRAAQRLARRQRARRGDEDEEELLRALGHRVVDDDHPGEASAERGAAHHLHVRRLLRIHLSAARAFGASTAWRPRKNLRSRFSGSCSGFVWKQSHWTAETETPSKLCFRKHRPSPMSASTPCTRRPRARAPRAA